MCHSDVKPLVIKPCINIETQFYETIEVTIVTARARVQAGPEASAVTMATAWVRFLLHTSHYTSVRNMRLRYEDTNVELA